MLKRSSRRIAARWLVSAMSLAAMPRGSSVPRPSLRGRRLSSIFASTACRCELGLSV